MSKAPSFVGRTQELQLLAQALRRSAEGDPQLVLFAGEPGIGKSSLLRAFALRAAQRLPSAAVLQVAAPSEGTIHDPVSSAAHELARSQRHGWRYRRRQAVQRSRSLLPDWLAAIPAVGALLAAVVATVQALGRRSSRRMPVPSAPADDAGELLLAAAERRPLVLLLDDLDRAARPAIIRLEQLVRGRSPRSRMLVVGAYRPAPAGHPARPIHELVEALPPGMVQRRKLVELTTPELEALVDRRFPFAPIPPSFLRWLSASTGGVPGAVHEALDLLVHRSVIHFARRRWQIEESPADAAAFGGFISAAPGLDLRGVSPAVVAVVRAASALPETFAGGELAAALRRDELYVEDQLALAAHHHLVQVVGETTTDSGEVATLFRFASPGVRAALSREAAGARHADGPTVRSPFDHA